MEARRPKERTRRSGAAQSLNLNPLSLLRARLRDLAHVYAITGSLATRQSARQMLAVLAAKGAA